MKKYYIEFYDTNGYSVQSDWFNTKQEALDWANKITYTTLKTAIMVAEFNENGCYDEIEVDEILR